MVEEGRPISAVTTAETRGGGYWMPSVREVRLITAQDEAAVLNLPRQVARPRTQAQTKY